MRKTLQTTFSSRQYMLSKDYEIYYYNDSHFYGITSHTHDYYEFYLFIEGDVNMNINGAVHVLKAGDVIIIPPNVPHYAILQNKETPYRRFVFWISTEYCNQLLSQSPDYVYLMQQVTVSRKYIYHYDVISFNALQAKAFRLIEEIHSDRFGKTAKVSLCVNDLILHLNRSVYEMEHPQTPREEQSLYLNVIQYIERHLDEELTLERLAGRFYVSKYHISHIFKENLGMSVHQYITKKRLAMCRAAILGNTNISEAYLLCGFKDYSSFYRAFKKEYGMSPKEHKELFSQESGRE